MRQGRGRALGRRGPGSLRTIRGDQRMPNPLVRAVFPRQHLPFLSVPLTLLLACGALACAGRPAFAGPAFGDSGWVAPYPIATQADSADDEVHGADGVHGAN